MSARASQIGALTDGRLAEIRRRVEYDSNIIGVTMGRDLLAEVDRLRAALASVCEEVELWRSIGGPQRCKTVDAQLARLASPAPSTIPEHDYE